MTHCRLVPVTPKFLLLILRQGGIFFFFFQIRGARILLALHGLSEHSGLRVWRNVACGV